MAIESGSNVDLGLRSKLGEKKRSSHLTPKNTKYSKIAYLFQLILLLHSTLTQLPPELDMSPSTPPGRTYRYLSATPLYCFGFGLSYGHIMYTSASVSPPAISPPGCIWPDSDCGSVTVCASLSNGETNGTMATQEVVQVIYPMPHCACVRACVRACVSACLCLCLRLCTLRAA